MEKHHKKNMHHCKRCGTFTRRFKYCETCSSIVEKEKHSQRNKQYRQRHKKEILKKEALYREQHREEVRLRARNFVHNHKEKMNEKLKIWRLKNPDKVKEQHKREWLNLKKRKYKRLYNSGKYPTKRKGKTTRISFCHTCGREIENVGRGAPRKYCECCYPQIKAIQNVFHMERIKQKNRDWNKEWYRNTHECVVALTCRVCNEIIIYKGKGMFPQRCDLCRGIERNKPKPIWNPKGIKQFIEVERQRLGLNSYKKWSKEEILKEYQHWEREFESVKTTSEE
jgi:hypothetical protein